MLPERNSDFLEKQPLLQDILDSIHEIVLILNSDRDIVFFNSKFKEFADMYGLQAEEGLKPGNALTCIYALGDQGECGTTGFCKYCGGNKAIEESKAGNKSVNSCYIVASNGNAFELSISASPLNIDGEQYTLYCINDTSAESRKRMLEKIFFHDVNNIINGISMIMELISEKNIGDEQPELNNNLALLNTSITSLKNEIESQQLITLAEKDELIVRKERINIKELLDNIREFFSKTMQSREIKQTITLKEDEQYIETDPVLLKRVIINTLKNACEASSSKQPVTLKCEKIGSGILISVNNSSVMSDEVKGSIFKRSFSTKGSGRGLGTYSMRLLTERYLGGSVYFQSEEGEGTTFYIKLPVS